MSEQYIFTSLLGNLTDTYVCKHSTIFFLSWLNYFQDANSYLSYCCISSYFDSLPLSYLWHTFKINSIGALYFSKVSWIVLSLLLLVSWRMWFHVYCVCLAGNTLGSTVELGHLNPLRCHFKLYVKIFLHKYFLGPRKDKTFEFLKVIVKLY